MKILYVLDEGATTWQYIRQRHPRARWIDASIDQIRSHLQHTTKGCAVCLPAAKEQLGRTLLVDYPGALILLLDMTYPDNEVRIVKKNKTAPSRLDLVLEPT